MQTTTKLVLLLAGSLLTFAQAASADTIETKDGARLVGTVVKIDGGNVTLETAYAGNITVKQAGIVRIDTEKPLVVRLQGGTTMAGTLATGGDGKVVLSGSDGAITTGVDKLATTWGVGETDPAVLAQQRKWSYEATFDLGGKTGNNEKFGVGAGFLARLTGPDDTLQFYTRYFYEKSDGAVSDDRFLAGIDYSRNFSERVSWYARDEGGYDNGKDIDFYNIAAAGFGYDFVKHDNWKLTGRLGLAYRYETWGDPATDDVKSAGLDVGLINYYRFNNYAVMNNTITWVPAFDDFADYRFLHDSSLEFPIGSSEWRLRIGVTNDYTSTPASGKERMDTTYYTKFLLRWQ